MPKDPESVPFFVLGNKVDRINERQVPEEKVAEWLKRNTEFIYYETSAMDGYNVEMAFSRIAHNYL